METSEYICHNRRSKGIYMKMCNYSLHTLMWFEHCQVADYECKMNYDLVSVCIIPNRIFLTLETGNVSSICAP